MVYYILILWEYGLLYFDFMGYGFIIFMGVLILLCERGCVRFMLNVVLTNNHF